jgi:hypothetical protein
MTPAPAWGSSGSSRRPSWTGSAAWSRCVGQCGRPVFERARADERGRFRVDQLLVELLRRGPDPVGDIRFVSVGQAGPTGQTGQEPSCVYVLT